MFISQDTSCGHKLPQLRKAQQIEEENNKDTNEKQKDPKDNTKGKRFYCLRPV
jgi:hypothetical protein